MTTAGVDVEQQEDFHSLLVEMQKGTATLEDILAIFISFYKTKIHLL